MPPGRSKGKEKADPVEHDADVAASIAHQGEKHNRKRRKSQTSSEDGEEPEDSTKDSGSGSGSRTKQPSGSKKGKDKGKTKGKTKARKKRKKRDPYYHSTMTLEEAKKAGLDQLALLETANSRVGKDGVPYVHPRVKVRDSTRVQSLMPSLKRSTMHNVLMGFLKEELVSYYGQDHQDTDRLACPLSRSDYEKAHDEGRTITVLVESKDISDAHEKFESRFERVAKKTDGSVDAKDFVCKSESDDSDFDPENWGDQNEGSEESDPGTPSSEEVTDVEEVYPGSSIVYSPRSPSPASDDAGPEAGGSGEGGSGEGGSEAAGLDAAGSDDD